MRVSVIIPWRGSADRRRNRRIVMDHIDQALAPAEMIMVDDPSPDGKFNRGRALNAGAQIASGEVLVFADADLIVDEASLRAAVDLCPSYSYVVPFSAVKFLTCEASTGSVAVALDAIHAGERPENVDLDWDRLSTGGCNVITEENWWLSGGFDPRFAGWGFEDAAFDCAARTLTDRPPLWLTGAAVHLWHEHDETRGDDVGMDAARKLCQQYEGADGDRTAMKRLVRARGYRGSSR